MTLPNIISFARICLIPPFVICLIQVQHHSSYRYAALGVLIVIGLSDVLDGYFARKRGEVTKFGGYLDQVADKLILITACILLSSDKLWPEPRFPNWIPAIIIGRELIFLSGIIIAFFVLKREIECRPNKLGKFTTFLQVVTIMAVLLGNHLSLNILIVLWCLVSVVTLVSAINYAYRGVKQL